MEIIDIGDMDCDTCFMQEILSDEIDDTEFLRLAIENLDELFPYIFNGNLNIRIHRDITGEMWFGWGRVALVNFTKTKKEHYGLQ